MNKQNCNIPGNAKVVTWHFKISIPMELVSATTDTEIMIRKKRRLEIDCNKYR